MNKILISILIVGCIFMNQAIGRDAKSNTKPKSTILGKHENFRKIQGTPRKKSPRKPSNTPTQEAHPAETIDQSTQKIQSPLLLSDSLTKNPAANPAHANQNSPTPQNNASPKKPAETPVQDPKNIGSQATSNTPDAHKYQNNNKAKSSSNKNGFKKDNKPTTAKDL